MDLLLDMEGNLLTIRARDPSARPFLLIPHQNSTGTAQTEQGRLSQTLTRSAPSLKTKEEIQLPHSTGILRQGHEKQGSGAG